MRGTNCTWRYQAQALPPFSFFFLASFSSCSSSVPTAPSSLPLQPLPPFFSSISALPALVSLPLQPLPPIVFGGLIPRPALVSKPVRLNPASSFFKSFWSIQHLLLLKADCKKTKQLLLIGIKNNDTKILLVSNLPISLSSKFYDFNLTFFRYKLLIALS